MNDCIFCKIVKGEIPCYKVYENEKVLAFLDINPLNKGHTLVIPKEHYKDIEEIPEDVLSEVSKVIKNISSSLLKFNEGVNVLQNNRSAAGQDVFHIHFHLIPRNDGDETINFKWVEKYKEGEAEKVLEEIKNAL